PQPAPVRHRDLVEVYNRRRPLIHRHLLDIASGITVGPFRDEPRQPFAPASPGDDYADIGNVAIGYPGFLTADDPFIPIASGGGLDVGRIGPDIRLGYRD